MSLGREFILEAAALGPEKGAQRIAEAMESATVRDRMEFFQALGSFRDDAGDLKPDTPPELVELCESVKRALLG